MFARKPTSGGHHVRLQEAVQFIEKGGTWIVEANEARLIW
jgi:hypothetical protein